MTDIPPNRTDRFSRSGFKTLCDSKLNGGPGDALSRANGAPSDFDLNPDARTEWPSANPVAAAVLIPVIARETLTVLFTERDHALPAHAGQIAFPGGKLDPTDADATSAALREAQEEVGLEPHLVHVLGLLDRYRTGTGFEITPVLALVEPVFQPQLNAREVASAFEVPLAFLMDPANHHRHSREIGGKTRHFYAMPHGDHYIWGATAGILKNLHERLFL